MNPFEKLRSPFSLQINLTIHSDITINCFKRLFMVSVFLLEMIFSPASVHAQKQEANNNSKWYLGGNIGLQVGQVTLIDVSPMVGYAFTTRITLGAGATYKYYRIKNYMLNQFTGKFQSFNSHITGGQVFIRYFVFRRVFAHTEYEYLRFRNTIYLPNFTTQTYDKQNRIEHINSVFIGAGYRQFIGPRSAFDILLLYNVNESAYSPYENPMIRMGFVFGI